VACLQESQALAFVAGDLDVAGRSFVEGHVDECAACRQLLAELVRRRASTTPDRLATDETAVASDADPKPPAAEDPWPPGTRVGRYVVLARLGQGAMGTVVRAEDIELGRPVALKRLHAEADAESRARLLREARSAAQLAHPSVVTVHEVGEHDGTPFLAMELVDGVTLTAWLRERTRPVREIVGVVAQAGRGLVAAHERGLVHRDFKPDNVLVDRAGRARVADFGLARAVDTAQTETSGKLDARLARMTASGSLAGTPAYMAPELVDGGAPDARSDQYAFAVTLHEALRGQHPFAGDSAAKLWIEMAEGRIRAGGRRVPAWLDRHVRRGLEVDPAKRWPDVASFVAAIEKPPRRALWLAGAGAVAAAGAIAVVAMRTPSAAPSCDDIASDYQPNIKQDALARAIPDPGQLALANKAIDRFTRDFRKALRESCRATQAGTQSVALGDKRTACLERAKRTAWFVTSGITSGIDKRPGLATLLEELPDPTACNDPEWLERASPLPAAQADRDALVVAAADLVRADKARDDGDLAQASKLLEQIGATAQRLGDRALEARAALVRAEIARDRGDMAQAELDAMDAWTAASTGGDADLITKAQLALLTATASRDRRAVDGFAGLGDVPETPNGARLIAAYGDALMAAGRFADGEAQYRRAQALRDKVLPAGDVELALGMQRIGAALVIQKRAKEALPILEAAHATVDKAFPPLRREAIDGVRYLAMAEEELGHLDRSLALRREVLARRTKVLGADSGLALDARGEVARALADLGYDDEAISELEAVIAGFLRLSGDGSVNAADARIKLANKLISVGRIAEADDALAKAVPVMAQAHGADSPYAMVGEYALVRAYTERAKPIKLDEATRLLDHMEPVFAKLFGRPSQPVGAVVYSRSRIAFARGDAKRALALVDDAIVMLDDSQRGDRAEMKQFRATVLLALGRRDDARASAHAAADDFEAAGPGFAKRAAAVRASF
jgi:tetratricopeptide (TPR) repeat protein